MRLRFLIQQYLVLFFFIINVNGQRLVIHQPSLKHKLGVPNRELANAFVDSSTRKLYLNNTSKTIMSVNFYKIFIKLTKIEVEGSENAGIFNPLMVVQ